jgi:hypothetical protein
MNDSNVVWPSIRLRIVLTAHAAERSMVLLCEQDCDNSCKHCHAYIPKGLFCQTCQYQRLLHLECFAEDEKWLLQGLRMLQEG